MAFDVDTYNTIYQEAKAEERYDRELKNRILKLSNQVRKQGLWSEHFPPQEAPNDDYLKGKVF